FVGLKDSFFRLKLLNVSNHDGMYFLALDRSLIYCWVGYPLILSILNFFCTKSIKREDYFPSVTVLLTVFNEEKVIRDRIENLLSLHYPMEKFEILVASDGSTDRTNEIVREFAGRGVRLFVSDQRKGKSATQNEAIKVVSSDILAFTDVDTTFDHHFLQRMVRSFAVPSVGCVSGQLLLRRGNNSVSESQGFYWRYETALRAMESRMRILSTASGQCMAIRRRLFKPLDGRYGDDCIIPLDVILQGYRVVHEPEAVAYDIFPSSIDGELKTRIRMTIRNWTGTFSRRKLLNPFRYPLISFSLISHKLLRWLTPYFLLTMLILNLLLIGYPVYQLLFMSQALFYSLALIGFILERKAIHLRIFTIPFSFCLANVGMFLGILRSFLRSRIIVYQADN
ncbi:MAG: glycosyltransferase family 2 protein, partial [Thermodesulfovibrionales bacterium]|nr:glycosyltransferase family 2 protein [Thermodesulfovibrionales bacterium]